MEGAAFFRLKHIMKTLTRIRVGAVELFRDIPEHVQDLVGERLEETVFAELTVQIRKAAVGSVRKRQKDVGSIMQDVHDLPQESDFNETGLLRVCAESDTVIFSIIYHKTPDIAISSAAECPERNSRV
jgi:hypothetical protein